MGNYVDLAECTVDPLPSESYASNEVFPILTI